MNFESYMLMWRWFDIIYVKDLWMINELLVGFEGTRGLQQFAFVEFNFIFRSFLTGKVRDKFLSFEIRHKI